MARAASSDRMAAAPPPPEGTPEPPVGRKSSRSATPRTPRRARQVEAKRTAILDAALGLFSRLGLHGTTVEQIAEQAAVSKTNLFYYFASKEEVYVAVLRRLLDEWLAPLRALERDSDPARAIGEYIRRKIMFSRAHPEASRLFCLEIVRGAPLLRRELETSLKQLVDAKAEVIRAWSESGRLAPVDPRHLIFAIWATTQHYADFAAQIDALLETGLDDEAFAEEAVCNIQRIILDGLRVRSPD
ncbi:TetR/AcrR family transcriptional regulator [Angulomicrobium tetraedrale]|uniref:TetR/AcrR family transcriptional regulator n=1 Tax=Ancylobacter tetraedralis TaxID=217068 RepID=A0A839Z5C9_9HYPH|nr:TetR/AcrR family transcriptional regulator [Ancylobacter tetraedralis]